VNQVVWEAGVSTIPGLRGEVPLHPGLYRMVTRKGFKKRWDATPEPR
jgi:hypothetical protein